MAALCDFQTWSAPQPMGSDELWGSLYSPHTDSSKDSSPLSSPFSSSSSGDSVFSPLSSTDIEDVLKSSGSDYDSGLGFDIDYFLANDVQVYSNDANLTEASIFDSTNFVETTQLQQSQPGVSTAPHMATPMQLEPPPIFTMVPTTSFSLPSSTSYMSPSTAPVHLPMDGRLITTQGTKRYRLTPKPYPDVKPTPAVEQNTVQNMELKLINNSTLVIVASSPPCNQPLAHKQASPCANHERKAPVVKTEHKQPYIPENASLMTSAELSAWRRGQRAIKNREAASISRTKKKEYVQSLEGTLKDVCEENDRLRQENAQLKGYVEILKIENDLLKSAETTEPVYSSVITKPSLTGQQPPHGQLFANVGAKAAVCLLVVGLLCVFNFGSIKHLQPTSFQSKVAMERLVDHRFTGEQFHVRSLLSVDDDYTEGRSLSDVQQRNGTGRHFNETVDLSCGSSINATETLRLVDELSSWVKRHERLVNSDRKRKSIQQKVAKSAEKQAQVKVDTKDLRGRKLGELVKNSLGESPWWIENDIITDMRFHYARPAAGGGSSIQVYESEETRKYFKFLEALQRREDTFYVVSFKRDYILLPALAHNKTVRPRMSLVMPAFPINDSMHNSQTFDFSMMQIDCEVVGTSLLQFPKAVVPTHLKAESHPRSNTTDAQQNRKIKER